MNGTHVATSQAASIISSVFVLLMSNSGLGYAEHCLAASLGRVVIGIQSNSSPQSASNPRGVTAFPPLLSQGDVPMQYLQRTRLTCLRAPESRMPNKQNSVLVWSNEIRKINQHRVWARKHHLTHRWNLLFLGDLAVRECGYTPIQVHR